MSLRRGLMSSMASGNKNLIYAKTVTMEKTASRSDPVVIGLPIMTSNYIILVAIVNYPSPPEDGYIALIWEKKKIGDFDSRDGRVLRANGTVGTDHGQCTYNESDGTLSIGGDFGRFPLGVKYEIYCIQML